MFSLAQKLIIQEICNIQKDSILRLGVSDEYRDALKEFMIAAGLDEEELDAALKNNFEIHDKIHKEPEKIFEYIDYFNLQVIHFILLNVKPLSDRFPNGLQNLINQVELQLTFGTEVRAKNYLINPLNN